MRTAQIGPDLRLACPARRCYNGSRKGLKVKATFMVNYGRDIAQFKGNEFIWSNYYFNRNTWILNMVSCSSEKCEVKVAREDVAEHVANTCVWKISNCHHCKEHVSQCQMEVKPN